MVIDSCDTCSSCTTQTCANGMIICETDTCPSCTTQTCADGSKICIEDKCPNVNNPTCPISSLFCYSGDCTCSNTKTQYCYCNAEPFSTELLACSYTPIQETCTEWSECTAQGTMERTCQNECGSWVEPGTCEPPVECPTELVCSTDACTCSNNQTQYCYCGTDPFSSELLACVYEPTPVCTEWTCQENEQGDFVMTRSCTDECNTEPTTETGESCEPECPTALVCSTTDCTCANNQTQYCYCGTDLFSSELLACVYEPTVTCTEWACTETSPGVFKQTRNCSDECGYSQIEEGITCEPECPLPSTCYTDDCCCLTQNEYCVDACTNELTVTPQVCNFTNNASCDWCACGFCYNACNADNQCVQMTGLGENNCISENDCYHSECVEDLCVLFNEAGNTNCQNNDDCNGNNTTHNECIDFSCLPVNGPGVDQCSESVECTYSTHKGCNIFGQCVDLFGPGTQDCPEDCNGFHTECTGPTQECADCRLERCNSIGEVTGCFLCDDECALDEACVLVPGAGNNECEMDDYNNSCKDHNVCTEDGQCIRTENPGIGECNNDAECDCVGDFCSHYECDIEEECVELPGPGPQDCDCENSHNECNKISRQCVVVDGPGADQCNDHLDCTDTHTECNSFNQCVVIDGLGNNECSVDADCSYYGCDNSDGGCSCILMSGIGQDDECSSNEDCLASPVCAIKSSCADLSCELEPCQEGEDCLDDCYSNEDCCTGEETYLACENEKCICKQGNLPDECNFDDECLYDSVCIYQQCIPGLKNDLIGLPGPSCSILNGNTDCEVENLPTIVNLVKDDGAYCTGLENMGVMYFSWIYKDLDNDYATRFDIEIDDNSDFSSPEVQSFVDGLSIQADTEMNYNVQVIPYITRPTQGVNSGFINYGVDYYWRVKVYSNNTDSGWIYYDNFAGTAEIGDAISFEYGYSHPAPFVNFQLAETTAVIGQETTFIDNSICYNNASPYVFACKGLPSAYAWNFGDGSTSNKSGSVSHIYNSLDPRNKTTSLSICDDAGCCMASNDIRVRNETDTELPRIREIAP